MAIRFGEWAIPQAGILPTNTPAVRKNIPGKNGEWRNGALTIQVVAVNADGTDGFTLEPNWSAGGHGVATSGLLYESTFFWHWGGRDYSNTNNTYIPGDPSTVVVWLTGGNDGHGNNLDGTDAGNAGAGGGEDTSAPVDDESGGNTYSYTEATCPANGLIADYEWGKDENAFVFKKGKFSNAITFSNIVYHVHDATEAISADFSSTVYIDAVEVETEKEGGAKALDQYNPPVSDGDFVSSDPHKMIRKVKFYCYYSGSYIGTGDSTITESSDGSGDSTSSTDPESYVLTGPTEPWVVLLDPDAFSSTISSVMAAAATRGLTGDDLLNTSTPLTGDGGNPFNLWNETYYGDELRIPGGDIADAGWFSIQSDLLDTSAFVEGTMPGSDLTAVENVVALDNTALARLIGRSVVGIVYDYDISIDASNNDSADLSGTRFGRFAFTVLGVDPPGTLTESTDSTSLWDVRIRVDSPYATPFDNIDTYTLNWLP